MVQQIVTKVPAVIELINTTAAFRATKRCTDTNSNTANFTAFSPAPRNFGVAANMHVLFV